MMEASRYFCLAKYRLPASRYFFLRVLGSWLQETDSNAAVRKNTEYRTSECGLDAPLQASLAIRADQKKPGADHTDRQWFGGPNRVAVLEEAKLRGIAGCSDKRRRTAKRE